MTDDVPVASVQMLLTCTGALALHREGFTSACLPVCNDGGIVALHHDQLRKIWT